MLPQLQASQALLRLLRVRMVLQLLLLQAPQQEGQRCRLG